MAKKVKALSKKGAVLIILGLIILTAFVIYKVYGQTLMDLWKLLETGDQDALAAYLDSQGRFGGYVAIIVISILQVVSIVIPGMIIQIASALIYGWWRAFLLCWGGFTLGNVIVFVVARIFGKSLEVVTESQQKNSWLMEKINQGNPVLVIAVACMIPGIPNGIIPYIAARSKITLKGFASAVAGSSWIQILLNCIVGHFLIRGEWFYVIASFALQGLLIYLVIKNRDKLMKA